jgi:hypothetical protein
MIAGAPPAAGRKVGSTLQQEPVIASPAAATAAPHCRNCGSVAPGAYCPACGQETRTRLPTFAQFMRDAAGRYVALDGKWWRTLGALIFRPGFLTREYLAGRRRRYVRPSRLFLVASLLVFAVLRLEVEFGGFEMVRFDDDRNVTLRDGKPTAAKPPEPDAKPGGAKPAAPEKATAAVRVDEKLDFDLGGAEDAIPGLKDRLAHFNRLPGKEKISQMTDGTLRYGPYAMFALLPAFAALLKVIYLGSGKRRPHRPRLYGEHLVFAAHNNAFLAFMVAAAVAVPHPFTRTVLLAWPLVYLLRAMRSVYGGTWLGTILRAFVMFVSYSAMFGVATAGLVIASVVLR